MFSSTSSVDRYLNHFYETLNNMINQDKKSITEYFLNDRNSNEYLIQRDKFNDGLDNLGIKDKEEIEFIFNRYKDITDNSKIDLRMIEKDYTENYIGGQDLHKFFSVLEHQRQEKKQTISMILSGEENVQEQNQAKFFENLQNISNNYNFNKDLLINKFKGNSMNSINIVKIENELDDYLRKSRQPSQIKEINESNIFKSDINLIDNRNNDNSVSSLNRPYSKFNLNEIRSRLENDIALNNEIIKYKLMAKIQQSSELNNLENKMKSSDLNNGTIYKNEFDRILFEYFVFSEKEKNVLGELAVEHNGIVNFSEFFNKLNYAEDQLITAKINYHIEYNDYLFEMRKKACNLNLNDIWSNAFQGNKSCNENEFINFMNTNFHSLGLNEEEIKYIFSVLAKNGSLEFNIFDKAMKNEKVPMNNEQDRGYSSINMNNNMQQSNMYNNLASQNQNFQQNMNNTMNSGYQYMGSGFNNNNNMMGSQTYYNQPYQNNMSMQNQNMSQTSPAFNQSYGQNNQSYNQQFNQSNNQSYMQQQEQKDRFVNSKLDAPYVSNRDRDQFNASNNFNNEGHNVNQAFDQPYSSSNGFVNNQMVSQSILIPPSEPTTFMVVRSNQIYNEVKNVSFEEKNKIIRNRFAKVYNKITTILEKHEKYCVISSFYFLNRTLNMKIAKVENMFIQNDHENRRKIDQRGFQSVLQNFGVSLPQERLSLLLRSLKSKTDILYSYDEFLENITNVQRLDNYQSQRYFKEATMNFDDYLHDFYIFANKADFDKHCAAINNNNEFLLYNNFRTICSSMNYKLSDEEEYRYIFQKFGEEQNSFSIRQRSIDSFLKGHLLTEDEFIKQGRLDNKEQNNPQQIAWKKNITPSTEANKSLYELHYKDLTKVFAEINSKAKLNCINNIVDYFDSESNYINPKGEIPINKFIDKMKILNITDNLEFRSLLNKFRVNQNQNFNLFKLAEFLTVYLSFYPMNPNSTNEKPQNQPQVNEINTGSSLGIGNQTHQNFNTAMKTTLNPPLMDSNYNKTAVDFSNENVVYANKHGKFTQKDIDNFSETFADMASLIIEDKGQTINQYCKSLDKDNDDYILLKDFQDFISYEYEIDFLKDHSMDKFFNYLLHDQKVNNQDVIKVTWLEHNLAVNSKGANVQVPPQKNSTNAKIVEEQAPKVANIQPQPKAANIQPQPKEQPKPVAPNLKLSVENQLIYDYAHFLNNNKIRFNSIYPSARNGLPVMPSEEFKNGFRNITYPIEPKKIDLLIQKFDPKLKEKIPIPLFKQEIEKYVPNYFKEPFQVIHEEKKVDKKREMAGNELALIGKLKIINYLRSNNIKAVTFFRSVLKKRNADEKITHEELITAFETIKGLERDEEEEIFNKIKDDEQKVSLSSLLNYLDESPIEERAKTIKVTKAMTDQINELFMDVDADKDDQLNRDEFTKALKAIDHKTTREDADAILEKGNINEGEKISKESFTNIIENLSKEQLIIQEEENEYMKRLFLQADIEKNGYLTPAQLRYIFKEYLNINNDEEIEAIIKNPSINENDQIDINELVKLLSKVHETGDENFTSTLIQITNKRRVNPKKFISIYEGLPLSFIPSFIREEQKLLKLLPSSSIKPKKDASGIFYKDIFSTSNSGDSTYAEFKQKSSNITAKISFQTATGVASPNEELFNNPDNKLKIVGYSLKIALYNKDTCEFFSNALSIEATHKEEYPDRWYFEEDRKKFNNNVIVRYSGYASDNVQVIFEFVLTIKRGTNTAEVSCGWAALDIKDLELKSEKKIEIQGGTPMKPSNIARDDIRTKPKGILATIASVFNTEVLSRLPVKIKPVPNLNANDRKLIDYLPIDIICHRASLNIIVYYRKIIADSIIHHMDYNIKVIKNEPNLIQKFGKIADCPDAFRCMTELWNQIIVDGATSNQKNDDSYYMSRLTDFVEKVYSTLFSEGFRYNELDPTLIPVGDLKLMEKRNELINSIIRNNPTYTEEDKKKFNKINYQPINSLTDFKPFTIYEAKEDKVSIVSKLDEFVFFDGE